MSEQEKMKRKIWTREETQGFLYCYHAHKDEFYHSRKKKFAYENVLKDMIDQGFTSPLTTTTALEGKMRTLVVAYKTAKLNGTVTPCIAPFIDIMDEIFEDNPLFTNALYMNMDTTNTKSTHTDASDEEKSQSSFHLEERRSESADEEQVNSLLTPKSESGNTFEQMPDNKRKVWTRQETLGLLYCYHARQDEFCHSKKRKSYANVLKDMIDQGFTNSTTSASACESKMRKLLIAFKSAKENAHKTSPSSGIAPFMSAMEKIFGDRPMFSKSHKTRRRKVSKAKKTADVDSSEEDQIQNSSQLQQWHHPESLDEETLPDMLTPKIHLSSLEPFPNPDPLSTITLGKRKSAQENFFDSQLKLKQEEIQNRQLMREAKHEQREKFMRESLNALQKKWERDHELDKKKLELLEKLIEK